ncbi:MAG: DNA polymerase III subunit alpha [Armatimonadetes bacterium]|nr:DNA polymerase III subunit alpha [Armatimonadota bacterium]NOG92695.1 DNA polymerase III subunit alpha [Armatimonadota bacterium]
MKVLAHWKEAGRWWEGEPEREILKYLDSRSVVRTRVREGAPLIASATPDRRNPSVVREAYTVDYEVRKREERDARVEAMKRFSQVGSAPESQFVPLHAVSAFSYGRSALYPEQIAALTAAGGMKAVAMTDRFSLAGAVAFARAAKEAGVKPILGATVEMADGGDLVLLVADSTGYANLSRLITICHREEPRLYPLCTWERLEAYSEGLLCLTAGHFGPLNRLLMARRGAEAERVLDRLVGIFTRRRLFVQIERTFVPWETETNARLVALAHAKRVQTVAANPALHASKEDFCVQDALLCAETLCAVEEILGRKAQRDASQPQVPPIPLRSINAERRMRTGAEYEKLFADCCEAIENTRHIANELPDWPLPDRPDFPRFHEDADAMLRCETFKGALARYKELKPSVTRRLNLELNRICDLGYASHFLAIWEACRWARRRGIHYSARGSVVDSAVAFCLGLSRIDAIRHDLHFDRFIPPDGSKRPDIDIDFEAHMRDDIRAFFVKRYGADRVAGISAISTYQGRGIVRMIGKALMIPDATLGYLAKRLHGSIHGGSLERSLLARPELRDANIPAERFRLLFEIADRIQGLPRQAAAHASGLVLSSRPLAETVPLIESPTPNVPIIQWDKYTSKRYFDKFDILCLRGQDVLAGTQEAIRISQNPLFDVRDIPLDDEGVFETFRSGELIGVPQSASPAMRQAHVRLRTQDLHDASLVQAGIRPGVGGAVKINALIRRRRGIEQYVYPHPMLEEILGKSYGIIVFQEQVDQLLQSFCGYTAGEAEEIREHIHKFRAEDWAQRIREELVSRCLKNGYTLQVAEHVFDLVSGFRGYGFAQGHALSFAEISIRCVYCQQNFPAEYFAALLSNQPAGYYGPGTIANEARVRGVRILPVDINESDVQFVGNSGVIRTGLVAHFGLSEATRNRIVEARRSGHYSSLWDFCRRVRPAIHELEHLMLSGAFDALHANRRALLWSLSDAGRLLRNTDRQSALFDAMDDYEIPDSVPDFTDYEKCVLERAMLGMNSERHLLAFERGRIESKGGISCAGAGKLKPGENAIVVGLAMRLRFPPTASGRRVVFFDLEDETGLLNVTCFDETYQKYGHTIICSPFVTLRGIAQDRDGHTAFLAEHVFPYALRSDSNGLAVEQKAVHAEDFIMRRGR